jgi:hypothetical protein
MKEAWGLISYSIQRNIVSKHVHVVGYFRHGSENPRLKEVQGMLNGIPGLTVNWIAVHDGVCSEKSLSSTTFFYPQDQIRSREYH